MEQQQFKVTISLRTKLLLCIVILLFAVIAFVNISAIFLLKQDKQAYVYQFQEIEAALSGKQFESISKHTISTLKVVLGSVDPLKPVTPSTVPTLQSILDNQGEVLLASIGMYDLKTEALTEFARASKEADLGKLQLSSQQFKFSGELLKEIFPSLQKDSYSLLNLSANGVPLLGVVFADLKYLSNPSGLPLAIGLVPLKDFASGLGATNLTIATRSGSILFDTDPGVLYTRAPKANENPLFQAALLSANSNVSSGAKDFSFQGTRYLGSYSLPSLNLVALSKLDWTQAMRATYALTERFILLGSMAIAAAVVFGILFSKTLTAPINRLYQGTKEVAEGKFNFEVLVGSRDEIGALTHSFNSMSKKIHALLEESVAKVRIENELAIASTVQQTLFPPLAYENGNVSIRSFYQSATECGGDWWGFFESHNKLCLMIADATGHGLPSALITASARSCFSVMAQLAQEDRDFTFSPSAMLSYANRTIYEASHGQIMMTFFIGVIDFNSGRLTYSSAGHNPPWLFKNSVEKPKLQSLTALGRRLGELPELPVSEEKTVPVEPGDVLLLYTDGLMEGTNQSGDQYGKKRARRIAETHVAEGPERLILGLKEDFLLHNQGKSLDDDITLAAVMVLPSAGAAPHVS